MLISTRTTGSDINALVKPFKLFEISCSMQMKKMYKL